jgi:hypothetical protein
MKAISALFAAVLVASAASASANTISLVNDTTGHVITTATDTNASYKMPAVSEANGVAVSFDFTYTGVLGNNDFFGAYFGGSTGPSFGLKANGGDKGTTTNDLFVRLGGTDGTFLAGSNLVAGTHYELLGYLSKSGNSGGNYNTLSLWVNPSADQIASLTGADITIKGDSGLASITSVGYRTVNIDNGVRLDVGDINVNAVPEPGTLALMGLALAGLGTVRRRKQA